MGSGGRVAGKRRGIIGGRRGDLHCGNGWYRSAALHRWRGCKKTRRPESCAGRRRVLQTDARTFWAVRDCAWPSEARFWLEWGCSDLLNSVIPTGADHREGDDLRSGGTCCFLERGTGRDRVGMDGTKTRTSGGKTLSSCRTAPLKPKPGLSGPPIPRAGNTVQSSRGQGRAPLHPEARTVHAGSYYLGCVT